jgi:amino acid permease
VIQREYGRTVSETAPIDTTHDERVLTWGTASLALGIGGVVIQVLGFLVTYPASHSSTSPPWLVPLVGVGTLVLWIAAHVASLVLGASVKNSNRPGSSRAYAGFVISTVYLSVAVFFTLLTATMPLWVAALQSR